MRYILMMLICAVALAIPTASVNLFVWDSVDTASIDSVVICASESNCTTYTDYNVLRGSIWVELTGAYADSVCEAHAYYDTSALAFVSPARYTPQGLTVNDTIYAELINDTIDANIVQISGDAGAADSLEYLLDGTGASLWIDKLRAGAYWTADTADTAVKIVSTNTGIYAYARGMHGIRLHGGTTGLYSYGGSGGITAHGGTDGLYCYGETNSGLFALGTTYGSEHYGLGYYGIYTHAPRHGIASVGVDSAGVYLIGGNYAMFAEGSRYANLRIDYTDTVNYIPEVSADGDTNLFNMATLATATQLTSAQDSIVSAVGLDVDTNKINILTVQDSIVSAIGLVSDSSAISSLLDSAFFSINAGSLYVHGGYIDTVIGTVLADINVNVVSPYAYATNRVRLENMNTPIKWAQAEQDTIKWDIDTTYNLAIYDSVIATFRAWQSRSDTTTLIYKTLDIDTLNNTASLYIEESETDSLSSGNYPADLWLDRYYGSDIIKTQIWTKTIQIDRSSRGTR